MLAACQTTPKIQYNTLSFFLCIHQSNTLRCIGYKGQTKIKRRNRYDVECPYGFRQDRSKKLYKKEVKEFHFEVPERKMMPLSRFSRGISSERNDFFRPVNISKKYDSYLYTIIQQENHTDRSMYPTPCIPWIIMTIMPVYL